jgi:hypothetical protein
MDGRTLKAFANEVATQCRFVIIAAGQLDDALIAPLRAGERMREATATADAYRRANPEDLDGYIALLEEARTAIERPEVSMARTWLALQSILISAANISKLLWGSGGGGGEKAIAKRAARRAPLRDLLETDDSSPLHSLALRNDFEQFDQRLERSLAKRRSTPYVGRNILHQAHDVAMPGAAGANGRFGHYDPSTATVAFWAHSVDLRELISEVQRILPLAAAR